MLYIIRWLMLVCVVTLIGSVLVGQAAATESAPPAASDPVASSTTQPAQLAPAQSEPFRAYLPLVIATAPSIGTGDPLPPDLAGTWFSGNLFQQDLYDPSTGHWANPSGLGQMYRFSVDGTYTYMGFLHIQNGACVSDVSVYKRGVLRLAPTVLTLQPDIAKTRTVIRCGNYSESITEGPFEPYPITWRVDYDDGGRLKLYIPEGDYTREYYKEGIAPALLSSWSLNGVRSANFYDSQTGRWATPDNNGAWLRFQPDGTYQYGGYVRKEEQGCAIAEWTYQAGTYQVSGSSFSLQASSGRLHQENSCTPAEVLDEPFVDPKLYWFSWNVHDRTTAPYLAISPLGQFAYLVFEREE